MSPFPRYEIRQGIKNVKSPVPRSIVGPPLSNQTYVVFMLIANISLRKQELVGVHMVPITLYVDTICFWMAVFSRTGGGGGCEACEACEVP